MKMLTDKQEAFCQAYVLQKNGTQAAIDAGYSPHTAQVQASRLLASSKVRERVDKLLRRQEECAQITADYVLMSAVEVYERCMGAAPVVKRGEQELDAAGNAVYAFDVKGALSALELIGKHVAVAAFKDRPTEKLVEKGVEKTADSKVGGQTEQLELVAQPVALSESERAARIAKILAMAQARRGQEQEKSESISTEILEDERTQENA